MFWYGNAAHYVIYVQYNNGGEQSLKEIAAALGYKNQLYFSAVFRKYHGIPPSKFQRVQLNEKA